VITLPSALFKEFNIPPSLGVDDIQGVIKNVCSTIPTKTTHGVRSKFYND
jgi:hypothetical protein